MIFWLSVGFVGALSYAFRLLPFLLADRVMLTPRSEAALRHASIGAMCALLVGTATASREAHGSGLALAVSLVVAGLLVRANSSMLFVVVSGLVTYASLVGVAAFVASLDH